MVVMMMFPKTVDEFMEQYKIVDSDKVYSNGMELVPIFRMKQWFEHIDAVPVVRCKDCRWHEQELPGMVFCPNTVGGWVEDNWFCKGGERKEDV